MLAAHAIARSPLVPICTNVNTKRRSRALLLIARLKKLTKSFPEFQRILDEALEELSIQANRTPKADRAIVLRAIHTGAWTIKEIIAETRLSRCETQAIIDRLLKAKIIIKSGRNSENSLGGRPEHLYIPAPNAPIRPRSRKTLSPSPIV